LVILSAVAATLLLAACGGSSTTKTQTTPRGPAYQTSKVQISTESCGGAGSAVGYAPCVIVLSNGSRYRCPAAQTSELPTASAVIHASACKRLKPVKIPASWKPVLNQLSAVRACLSHAGITVTGGATLGLTGRTEKTPIGELTLVGTSAPTLINFYESSAAAKQAQPGLDANSRRSGGSTLRRGPAIIAWSAQPDANERAGERQCLNG
jgi:hypothetical protein